MWTPRPLPNCNLSPRLLKLSQTPTHRNTISIFALPFSRRYYTTCTMTVDSDAASVGATAPPVHAPNNAPAEPATKKRKLLGREFYESIGSPTTIVAPMVDQSELAWRLLSRRHSPPNTLCYTPMFHSRNFATSEQYRRQCFQPPHLDGNPANDRPTFVQFCSNHPGDLLSAARQVQDVCDAVDLNLGCPQGIARKGRYGAFLQEDWPLIHSLINTLHKELDVPVTAKIRILETKERSLDYAKMVVDAGATILTVHGRTREQKGHNTGLADWSVIRYIRDHIPANIVMFANGNILWHEDVQLCLEATAVDGVMSAEGNLYNPAVFQTASEWEKRFPRMDAMGREYLNIIREEILPHLPLKDLLSKEQTKKVRRQIDDVLRDASLVAIKSHLFKLWHTLLPRHTHIRDMLARSSPRYNGTDGKDPLAAFEACQEAVEEVITAELAINPEEVDANGSWIGPDKLISGPETAELPGIVVELRDPPRKVRRCVPWYRCQPYYRPLPDEAVKKGALTLKSVKEGRKAEDAGEDSEIRKKVKVDEAIGKEVEGITLETIT